MPQEKSRRGRPPKKYTNGVEKADYRLYGLRFKKNQIHTKDRLIKTAEIIEKSINDFIIEDIFPYFFSRHFEDIKLRDLERIFRELEKVPWSPDLQKALSEINKSEIKLMDNEWKKTNHLEKYSLHPSIPLKFLFEADHRFFSNFKDFDKKILFQAWGEFLFEQGIITYGLQIPDINDQFIDRFETLADLSLTFLTSYQSQLRTLRGFKEMFEEERSSIKELIENGNLDPEKIRELENERKEVDKDDQLILGTSGPDKTPPIISPEKDPIFPIIRIQSNTEIVSNWGINELKTLENFYSSSSYISTFLSIFNLWRRYADSLVHLTFLIKSGITIRELSPQFYKGLRKFIDNSRFFEDSLIRMLIGYSRLNQEKEIELFKKIFETIGKSKSEDFESNLYKENLIKLMAKYIDPELIQETIAYLKLIDYFDEDKEEKEKEEK